MKNLACFSMKTNNFQNYVSSKLSCLNHSSRLLFSSLVHDLLFRVNPFWIQLSYFTIISFFGYLALMFTMPKNASFQPKSLDLFFMSTSASTVSSMSTVEMEVFSNTQLIIMTFLMLVGGEVFVSMLGLHLMKFKKKKETQNYRVDTALSSTNSLHQLELGSITHQELNIQKPNSLIDSENLKHNAVRSLGYVVLFYLLVVHLFGSSLIALYILIFESSRKVLKKKGLSIATFSIFTTVSTFSNCGFVPTNENMIVFKKNTGLLLIIAPQILLGNTLYPPFLSFLIWFLERFTKKMEFRYILKNRKDLGYKHLLSKKRCKFLGVTVFGFILVMMVGFCSLEWNSKVMEGLSSSYEKVVGSLFVVINSRHAGESVFDLSIVSSAILVLFVFMMYLPPYTSFSLNEDEEDDDEALSPIDKSTRKKKSTLWDKLLFSHISYLVIFTILVCITERQKLKEDPLNFNILNIIVEITSAYGNVGFTTGYSCQRQLKPDGYCEDKYYGFVGRWSRKGKFVLIIVMFFGRLKNFSMKGGSAWKLS
ncbi:hypothetical protein LguiA_025824 [Lonicera macranthoides]